MGPALGLRQGVAWGAFRIQNTLTDPLSPRAGREPVHTCPLGTEAHRLPEQCTTGDPSSCWAGPCHLQPTPWAHWMSHREAGRGLAPDTTCGPVTVSPGVRQGRPPPGPAGSEPPRPGAAVTTGTPRLAWSRCGDPGLAATVHARCSQSLDERMCWVAEWARCRLCGKQAAPHPAQLGLCEGPLRSERERGGQDGGRGPLHLCSC